MGEGVHCEASHLLTGGWETPHSEGLKLGQPWRRNSGEEGVLQARGGLEGGRNGQIAGEG